MFSDSDDEGSDNAVKLEINEHYAKAFNYRKEREELAKLKEKYGEDFEEEDLEESTDSESAESEDEDGEELTPAVDAAILRTLARIRKKDPAIYDSQKSIFGEEQKLVATAPKVSKKPKDKSKPVTMRQVALEHALRGSRSPSPESEPEVPTHAQEQDALRRETIAAFQEAVSDDDDILVLREKTKDQVEAEEEEYKAYLQRQVGSDLNDLISLHGDSDQEAVRVPEEEPKQTKKAKKKTKKKEETDQEFLMNYILNRGWLDKSSNRVPTYKEVTSSKKGKGKQLLSESEASGAEDEDVANLSDTSFDSLADQFESSYNHRFEEPGADTIATYPRSHTLATTIRRADSTRKEARERKKERKEEELAKKREEVKRLKALKMKEIKRKLEQIGKEGGLLRPKGKSKKAVAEDADNGELDDALKELDLEGEWDPSKHDAQMEDLFANAEEDFGEGEGEDEGMQYDANGKPIWNDDIDIGDIYMSDDDAVPAAAPSKKDKKKKKKKKKGGDDDEDMGVDVDAMDADAIAQKAEDGDEEEWDGTEEMRKRKWNEYMNELYELDFNDIVGGLPTRFKYTSIPAQSYSLDPVEILMADDEDLNEYMSIKKYAPYRKDRNSDRSRWDPRQQEKLRAFKEKLGEKQKRFGGGSRFNGAGGSGANAQQLGEGGEEGPKKKRKGKKERMKAKGLDGNGVAGEETQATEPVAQKSSAPEQESKKKRKREAEETTKEVQVESKPVADADAPTKKKRRRRTGKDKKGDQEEA